MNRDCKVILASPYPGVNLRIQDGSYVLIRQYNFPYNYHRDELYLVVCNDVLRLMDAADHQNCLNEFKTTNNNLQFDIRVEKDPERVLEFLKKLSRADRKIKWTGFRVAATTIGHGQATLMIELFAKDPESDTPVYSGENDVPNVRGVRVD